MAPSVITELTLARNVVTAQPSGATIAEISSATGGTTTSPRSEVRVLPIANAEETDRHRHHVPTVDVDGIDARVFTQRPTSRTS